MSDERRSVTLGEIFTDDELTRVEKLWKECRGKHGDEGFHKRVMAEVATEAKVLELMDKEAVMLQTDK